MRRGLLPSPADVIFVLMLLAAAVLRGWQAVNTDGDLGRHLRVGETILQRGGLFYEDLFSWTMAGRPFVPYEWLSEVLFALAHRAAGIAGAVALTALVVASSYFALSLLLRRVGVDPLLGFLTVVAAGAVGAFHWLARPHVFTFLGTVALLWLLEVPRRRTLDGRSAGLAFVLFAVWANLHGGFLFGLVLIGMYLAGDALGARDRIRGDAVLLVAALLGCMVNPVGPALLGHVAGYLGQSYLVAMTLEYRSPDFHQWIGRAFLAVLMVVVGALALSRRSVPMPRLIAVLGTTAFALHSVRNVPLWGIAALALVAMHLNTEWRSLGLPLLRRIRGAFDLADRQAGSGWWSVAAAVGLAAVALAGGRAGGVQLIPDRFDPTVFPVDGVEQVRTAGIPRRLFNELAWGGYLLYAWPDQRVFIDGQTDFYGEELSREYVSMRGAEPGWHSKLDKWGIDAVILPFDAPLAEALAADSRWLLVSNRRNAEVYARRSIPPEMVK